MAKKDNKKVSHSKLRFYDVFLESKTKRTYTNLIASLVLIIVFLVFALRPTITTIGEIRDEIDTYKEYNQKLKRKADNANVLNQQFTQTLTQQINFIDEVFFTDPNLKDFYNNIKIRADESDVAIKNFSVIDAPIANNEDFADYDNSVNSPGSSHYTVEFTVQSFRKDDLKDFLSKLEGYQNFPVFSRVTSFLFLDEEIKHELDELVLVEDEDEDEEIIPSELKQMTITMVVYQDSQKVVPDSTDF